MVAPTITWEIVKIPLEEEPRCDSINFGKYGNKLKLDLLENKDKIKKDAEELDDFDYSEYNYYDVDRKSSKKHHDDRRSDHDDDHDSDHDDASREDEKDRHYTSAGDVDEEEYVEEYEEREEKEKEKKKLVDKYKKFHNDDSDDEKNNMYVVSSSEDEIFEDIEETHTSDSPRYKKEKDEEEYEHSKKRYEEEKKDKTNRKRDNNASRFKNSDGEIDIKEIQAYFLLLKRTYPDKASEMPVIDEFMDPKVAQREVERWDKLIRVETFVEDWTGYTKMGFVGIEIFMRFYLNIDEFEGFTKRHTQPDKMIKFERLLLEWAEKNRSISGPNWPIEVRFITTLASCAFIYWLEAMLAKVGGDFLKEKFGSASPTDNRPSYNTRANQRPQPKMKPPNVRLSEID